MDILKKLKQKLTARRQDGVTRYWHTLEKIADGNMTDRAADAAIEAIEPLLSELGKSEHDVEADLALLRDHAAAKATAEAAANDRAAAADLRVDAARLQQRSDELHGEHIRLRDEAADTMNQASGMVQAADKAAQELARSQRLLAAAGHPQLVARGAEDARAGEIQRLQGELTSLEHGMLAVADPRQMSTPESRRDEIAARLRDLGHPVDEARLAKPLPGGRPKKPEAVQASPN